MYVLIIRHSLWRIRSKWWFLKYFTCKWIQLHNLNLLCYLTELWHWCNWHLISRISVSLHTMHCTDTNIPFIARIRIWYHDTWYDMNNSKKALLARHHSLMTIMRHRPMHSQTQQTGSTIHMTYKTKSWSQNVL